MEPKWGTATKKLMNKECHGEQKGEAGVRETWRNCSSECKNPRKVIMPLELTCFSMQLSEVTLPFNIC